MDKEKLNELTDKFSKQYTMEDFALPGFTIPEMPEIELSEITPFDETETAKAVIETNKRIGELNEKLGEISVGQSKSDSRNKKLTIAIIIISSLTLLATALMLLWQFGIIR